MTSTWSLSRSLIDSGHGGDQIGCDVSQRRSSGTGCNEEVRPIRPRQSRGSHAVRGRRVHADCSSGYQKLRSSEVAEQRVLLTIGSDHETEVLDVVLAASGKHDNGCVWGTWDSKGSRAAGHEIMLRQVGTNHRHAQNLGQFSIHLTHDDKLALTKGGVEDVLVEVLDGGIHRFP